MKALAVKFWLYIPGTKALHKLERRLQTSKSKVHFGLINKLIALFTFTAMFAMFVPSWLTSEPGERLEAAGKKDTIKSSIFIWEYE